MKKLLSLFVLLCMLALACIGCGSNAKTFTAEGLTVTLTDDFKQTTIEGYTVAFDSANVAVLALKESFSLLEGLSEFSLEEYGELVIENNGKDVSLQTADGLVWFEFSFHNADLNKDYHYFSYVYKANDAFWLIQFSCLEAEVATYQAPIATYAKSVTFA